jgi:hypothetical protein
MAGRAVGMSTVSSATRKIERQSAMNASKMGSVGRARPFEVVTSAAVPRSAETDVSFWSDS